MSTTMTQVAFAIGLVLLTTTASAERLNRNPFRPPTEFLEATAAEPGGPTLAPGTRPEIRGILLAGKQSLVNLGGKVIGVGESANGYRLLEVGEEHAVFERGDEVITLSLYPDKEDVG